MIFGNPPPPQQHTKTQKLKSKNHLKLYFDLQQGTLHADAKLFAAQQARLIIQ